MAPTNNPPIYPLKDISPKLDFRLVNPGGKLLDFCLDREYENLSLLSADGSLRENRKRIRNSEEAKIDEIDGSEACDDMVLSDMESSSQISVHSNLMFGLATRENSSIHPSKRRLTSVISPKNIDEHNNEKSFVHPRTPIVNSPPNPPVSDIEEQPQQLPLPSPSASPDHSAQFKLAYSPIENHLIHVPTTQAELIDMIMGLSGYLNDKNQNHLIFKLLQNINRTSLSSFDDLLFNNLKRDVVSNLPLEISYRILSHLDYKTLLSISEVCSSWYKIINNEAIWIKLLKRDKLVVNDEEILRELNDEELLTNWHSGIPGANMAQTLYKKRRTILNRWMDPKYEPKRISVPGHGSNVVTCLQHDDEKIVTGVDDKLINIYSVKTGKLIKVLKGHEGGVWALKYTGDTLVSGSTDRTVRIWSIKTGKCTHVFRGHTSTIRCLDIIHPVKIGVNDSGEDIIFPEVPLIVTGSRDHNLHVWKLPNVDECADQPMYDTTDGQNPYLVAVLLGHTQSVRSVCAYGNLVVSGSYDTTVRVWDLLQNGRCVHILTGHSDRIYSTTLNFASKKCYSGSMDSTINIWDIEEGKLLHTLEGHTSLVGLLELSDETLVSAAADSTVRVWNPRTGENVFKLEGHSTAITCFQHDRLRIISGSERMLKLWDIRTGKYIRDLLSDITGGIWQVRFDYNRCVAAVQRSKNDVDETFIEILDFSESPTKQR